ncbi:MAG: DNA polymerase III subunit alpha [Verrucomicrobia bacterium]|nr:DNA polymerase III subunit alpha [Verrucomicrobiota bacterium]
MPRVIVHLDADAFFASVEQAADSRLRGKPVAVGGEKRGIIASASYEARKFGVFTPMPTVRARKLCPKLIVLPGDFDKYEHFSRWMFSYAQDFTPDVEIASIDEGYFDLSGVRKPSIDVAQTIRAAIRQSLKISVSEGIGTNKLISQIASKLHKPAAFAQVLPGHEIPFLHPLPNHWLPGIGPKTASRLNAAGLAHIKHIAATPLELLNLLLGKLAVSLKQFANGIDDRPVVPLCEPAKSYSKQETFAADLTDEKYAEAVLRRMADELMAKVRADGKSIRTLTVKVCYNDMAEDQRGESLPEPTDLETDVYGRIHTMLKQAWKRRVSLRMVSLKLSNVYDGLFRGELPLERAARQHEARRRLAGVVDDLRRARGQQIILRGHDFQLRDAPREAVVAEVTKLTLQNHKSQIVNRQWTSCYVPLRAHSHYSFLDSTLSPAAIVQLAKQHGLPAVALTDTGNLHGAVEFVEAAKKAGVKPILGTELRVGDKPLLLYVESPRGYHNLCRLLSRHAELTASNGDEASVAAQQHSPFRREELNGFTDGLIAVSEDTQLAEMFPDRFYQMAARRSDQTFNTQHSMPNIQCSAFRPSLDVGRWMLNVRCSLSFMERDGMKGFPIAACPPIRYATPEDRQKYDIVQSIRTLTLLQQEHPDKLRSGRFHFRTPAEMAAACQQHPDWLRHTCEIAERCNFDLPFGKPQFPAFTPPDGSPPSEFLRRLVLEGLRRRYPKSQIANRQSQIETELGMINEVGYEEYFLITWDFLQECRRRGIEWITRGSAADSLVCHCLGISSVCPIRFDLYFRRFLNKERMALNKLPDIDIDFAHDFKDDVVKLIFEKYGREHCAVVGGFSTFQARSAFAEVAKVLGVAEREVRKFTDHFPWSFGGGWVPDEPTPSGGAGLVEMLRASPENRDLPFDEEPYRTALEMAEFLDGVPRYPKMHPCGLVLSRQPMHELTPTFIANKGYATTQFDMDAVETIGLVKMDILAQGGLAAMRDVKATLGKRGIEVDLDRCVATRTDLAGGRVGRWESEKSSFSPFLLFSSAHFPTGPPASPPPDRLLTSAATEEPWCDPNVWEMIAEGSARAVHHIESPAMTSLCRMCNVREIDGLIAIVSVIRPGAANEGKKLSFTRRYQGLEPVTYPHPSLEACLRSTYGLVVYEEHILQLCEAFAGLPPGRADVLRRALNKQKRAVIEEIRGEFFASALARGHSPEKTVEVWGLVTGFAGYAFCKAHSTAYGVEAYQSAWLKRYFPAEFMAAVLTNGKGFYNPLVYVLECHRLGLKLLPPSANEPGPAFAPHGNTIRVPLLRVKGLAEKTKDAILRERERGPFDSLRDFYCRVLPSPEEIESMIRVGAFDEFGQARTAQFWDAQRLVKSEIRNPKSEIKGRNLEFDFDAGADAVSDFLVQNPSLLREPTRRERLEWETELLGFTASGHPLELYNNVAWETYCPVARLGEHVGEEVVTCGLVIEQRVHHQITGEPMKFLTLADWTGMVETELFAATYKSYGLATVRYPVLEITATVEPFENGRGFSLRVLRAGKPRTTMQSS